jgi:MscS family membrane protein
VQEYWWIEIIVGVAALFGLNFAIKKMISHLHHRVEHRPITDWRRQMDRVIGPPLLVLLWILGGSYGLDVIGQRFGMTIVVSYLAPLRGAGVIACFAWTFFRWKREFERAILLDRSRKIDRTTIRVAGRLATIGTVVFSALLILQVLGFSTAPLVAFGGIGAASLGFAGKDVIANFCSGIMLQIARPFVIGDQILLPEKDLEGHIEEIGWFRTSLRDKEKRAVYLPNNFFSTMLVINVSRMTHRRILQLIRLRFTDREKVMPLVREITALLEGHAKIDRTLPLYVYLKDVGSHGLHMEIEAHSTETEQGAFNEIEQEIMLQILGVFAAAGVDLEIPSIHVVTPSGAERACAPGEVP